jgi:exosome complex protein LRP1
MDPANVQPSLDLLNNVIDDLEEALQPLANDMTDMTSKLPLLDKAKLYVLLSYSIESLLFCKINLDELPDMPTFSWPGPIASLRLNEVDAKEHPVFKELARVRQYFTKIKDIESPPQKPKQSLNKEAAIRLSVCQHSYLSLSPRFSSFRPSISLSLHIYTCIHTYIYIFIGVWILTTCSIRSDLAENKEINTKLSEMIAKERAKAALKTSRLGEKRKLDEAVPEAKPSPKSEAEDVNTTAGTQNEVAEPAIDLQSKKRKSTGESKRDKSPQKEKGKTDKSKKEKKKSKKASKSWRILSLQSVYRRPNVIVARTIPHWWIGWRFGRISRLW